MTTEYEPGRIYSGVYVNGKREIFMWSGEITGFVGKRKTVSADRLTEIRGPLVVLDLDDLPYGLDSRDVVRGLRSEGTYTGDRIADQIEEQTKPPLEIGWHECVESHGNRAIVHWDGNRWHYPSETPSGIDWTSTHFIGKASRDE